MTEQNEPQPTFEDSPTTATQPSYPLQTPTPIPPRGPEMAPPPSWQPAGIDRRTGDGADFWTPAGQAQPAAGGAAAVAGSWLCCGALIIVVAAAGVAVFALSSKTNAAIGPTFLPPTTPLYVEVRLDLPGGQRDNVIKLLSHFPGFADPSTFDKKWDRRLRQAGRQGHLRASPTARTSSPGSAGRSRSGCSRCRPPCPASPRRARRSRPAQSRRTLRRSHAVIGVTIKDRSQLDTLLTTIRAVPGSGSPSARSSTATTPWSRSLEAARRSAPTPSPTRCS